MVLPMEGRAALTKLVDAPIRYVLTIVRFPRVVLADSHLRDFQSRLKGKYPLKNEQMQQGLGLTAGPNGIHLGSSAEKMVQFSRADLSAALILSSEFLLFHTSQAYEGHVKFFDDFLDAMRCLLEVKDLPITVATGLGCRYVDLVVPRESETLGDYLQGWALPTEMPDKDATDLKFIEGVYVSGFKTSQGVLRFQAIRRPNVTLSPDLNTPFVQMNHWVVARPLGDFAILDIDHGKTFSRPAALSVTDFKRLLYDLHGPVRHVFNAAATDFAMRVWGGQA